MRLELTRRTDLALKGLRYLSVVGSRTKAAELAAALGTSTGFLQQAMKPVVVAGWVTSGVGPTGGYTLDARAHAATVLDVIEASEGPVDDGRCVLAESPCPSPEPCAMHDAWSGARAALVAVLAATPALNDLANPQPGDCLTTLHVRNGDTPASHPTGTPVTSTERT